MAQEIMLDPYFIVTPVAEERRGKDSKEALALSLHKLEELASVIAQEEVSGGKESSSNVNLESVVNSIRDVLVKNPSAFDDVLKLIAPQTKSFGEELLVKLVGVKKNIDKFSEAVSGIDKKTYGRDFQKHIAPYLIGFGASNEALNSLCDNLKPMLESLYAKNSSKMQTFLVGLLPVLALVSTRNPEKANDVVRGFTGTLEKTYSLPAEEQKKFFKALQTNLVTLSKPNAPSTDSLTTDSETKNFLDSYVSSGKKDSPDMNGNLAQLMIVLQMFQMTISQMQIDKDNIQTEIGDASIKVAQENQQNVEQEIAKANAEAEAAKSRPWWETLVEIVVAVVGAVIAGITGGAGAAFVAIAVGAFMASPGFSDSVSALGGVITKALESAGMSKAKAEAFGDMLAKVIIIIVIAVASAGIGGIGATTEGATNATVDATADATATSVADSTASSASDEATSVMNRIKSLYKSLTKPFDMSARGKIFTFELVSNLAGSGIWMDAMEMDPTFLKKHPKLVEALNILATVIGVIVSMIVGAKSFSGLGNGKSLLEKFPALCKGAIPLNFSLQAGSSGMESFLSYQRAGFLEEEARLTRDIGQAEANIIFSNAISDASNSTLQTINSSATAVTKQIADDMSNLCNNSGAVWKEAAQVLAH
jgi:hypothetical protein